MIETNEKLPSIDQMFMIFFDDREMDYAPMVWDSECDGAICPGISERENVAIFASKKDARRCVELSRKWNALLKAQGKSYYEHFEGKFERECRKNLRILPCAKFLHRQGKP
jgi:hypothetical protein